MPRIARPPDAADTSLRQQVYASLREALTSGRFAPGQKVTFRYVAGELGVSLTPVREAILYKITGEKIIKIITKAR